MTHRCLSLHCGTARRTAVYRLYDKRERLLYAGIAYDTEGRWQEHARDKPWWRDVYWKTIVWHGSRLGAAIEEYCAIRYENPVHNKRRDYDRRLGWESTDAPGSHAPRPWRLSLLASAMTHPGGGAAGRDANPHYAAVICADQGAAGPGCTRIWFPQAPDLGYWACGPMKDPGSKDEIHSIANGILTEDYGLRQGSFTLSVHDPDGCAEPTLTDWSSSADAVDLSRVQRLKAGVRRAVYSLATAQLIVSVVMGIGVASVYNLGNAPEFYGQVAIDEIGAACGVVGFLGHRFLGFLDGP
jgi:hypothetical protein